MLDKKTSCCRCPRVAEALGAYAKASATACGGTSFSISVKSKAQRRRMAKGPAAACGGARLKNRSPDDFVGMPVLSIVEVTFLKSSITQLLTLMLASPPLLRSKTTKEEQSFYARGKLVPKL